MDAIVDSNDSYFQLSMGGWIAKSYVDLLPEQSQWKEEVNKTTYTILKNGESLVLDGKAAPAFKAYSTGEKIALRFYNTSGIELDEIYSELFSSVDVSTVGEDTILEFYKNKGWTPSATTSATTAREGPPSFLTARQTLAAATSRFRR